MTKAPADQFYWNDYMRDTRRISLAARGGWVDILGEMRYSPTRGMLNESWVGYARIMSATVDQAQAVIIELIEKRVCDWWIEIDGKKIGSSETEKLDTCNASVTLLKREFNGDVTLINRRMYREYKARENTKKRVAKHRKKGGCNGDVTPPSSKDFKRLQNTSQPPLPPLTSPAAESSTGGNAAHGGECVESPEQKTPEEKEQIRENYKLAALVCTELHEAHPETVRETRALIEQANFVISKLREEGKSLDQLRAAHEFALGDVRDTAGGGGWTGWRSKYFSPGNWLKKSSSGIRWIDIWMGAGGGSSGRDSKKRKLCRGCGKDVEKLNFELMCGVCEKKEEAELERLRNDPNAQKRAKQAMEDIWGVLGQDGKEEKEGRAQTEGEK